MFTITGKKTRIAAIAIFDVFSSGPNHWFVIGAKAMIGTAFAAIANGISARPSAAETGEHDRSEDGERAADHEAAERFGEGVDPGCEQLLAALPERVEDRRRRREQEALDVEHAHERFPGEDPEHEHRRRGDPVDDAAPDAGAERPARKRRDDAHSPSSAT